MYCRIFPILGQELMADATRLIRQSSPANDQVIDGVQTVCLTSLIISLRSGHPYRATSADF
jgi:hypothetical protein